MFFNLIFFLSKSKDIITKVIIRIISLRNSLLNRVTVLLISQMVNPPIPQKILLFKKDQFSDRHKK